MAVRVYGQVGREAARGIEGRTLLHSGNCRALARSSCMAKTTIRDSESPAVWAGCDENSAHSFRLWGGECPKISPHDHAPSWRECRLKWGPHPMRTGDFGGHSSPSNGIDPSQRQTKTWETSHPRRRQIPMPQPRFVAVRSPAQRRCGNLEARKCANPSASGGFAWRASKSLKKHPWEKKRHQNRRVPK